jgi:hypothetical protein
MKTFTLQKEMAPIMECMICCRPAQPQVSGLCGECRAYLQKNGIFEAEGIDTIRRFFPSVSDAKQETEK